jgi:lipoprotein-anchoring transpeptidase ErfK/SrfK
LSVRARVAAAAALAVAAAVALIGIGSAETANTAGTAAPGDTAVAEAIAAPAAVLATHHAAVPNSYRQPPSTSAHKPAAPAPGPPGPTPAAPPPAPAGTEHAPPPPPVAMVPGTPCTSTARACVDLKREVSWLIDNGRVVNGPEEVASGDAQTPTPRGTFKVQWKAEQYTSREYLVQMPYSVFFADGGIAFHEGNRDTPSGGCVKLEHSDAVEWFNFLQVGDEVQIH